MHEKEILRRKKVYEQNREGIERKMRYKRKLTNIYKKGYKRYSDSDKLVHQHVAEMMLGRKLLPGETVHHKNRNKLDNRRKNLWVFESQQKHYQVHKKDEKKYGRW